MIFTGNVVWYPDWIWIATDTRSRDLRPASTVTSVATKPEAEEQQLSDRTGLGLDPAEECSVIADGEAGLLPAGDHYGRMGPIHTE